MNDPQVSKIRRPPKELRDQARRDQIVDAARQCVVRRGFHAASMAEIALAARMSVGQIYRYFPNKEAIVHAIVERIVAKRLEGIVATAGGEDAPTVLAERLAAGVSEEHREDDILLLEVTAEATRNPAVAEIVREADRRLHAHARATFMQGHPEFEPHEASVRVELIAVLIEGTMFRRLTGRGNDVVTPPSLYRTLLEQVMTKSY